MRVVLDECLPRRLGKLLTGHEVATVPELGYAGKKNGELLSLLAGKFDVFVTVDSNLPAQQNMSRHSIGVVVIRASSNRLDDLQPLVPEMLSAIALVRPHDVVTVGATS
ncbi:MAG: DUF5615 family PIN-like protein [Opitutaceae bacterium]